MNEATDTVVRVPAEVLASRPHGVEVAARLADLLEAMERAAADPPVQRDTDPAVAAEADLVDEISFWERAKSRADARQVKAMAALAASPMFAGCAEHGHNDPTHGVRGAASVVSAELRNSPGLARSRVALACELTEQLPAVVDALAAGSIDLYKARLLTEETRPLAEHPGLRRTVVDRLLVKAGRQTSAQLRAAARKAVLAADPAGATERHQRARKERALYAPWPEPDGMASMWLRLPAEDALAFFLAVAAAARQVKTNNPKDPRTLEQIRADIIAELGWSALSTGHLGCCNQDCHHVSHKLGEQRGKPAHVGVTVPFSTLFGMDEQPGDLHGYGPITPDVARKLAADGTWRRLLTDPVSGALRDYGTTRYTAPPELAELIIARDRTCRFPTCTWPAEACDLDHTVPFSQGGATADSNFGPVHRGHHNDHTHHGWQVEQPEDGRFVWTAPTGHRYEVDREVIGPFLDEDPEPKPQPPPEADPDPPPF
ncbi:MAG: DUF222 domain-containing protein [Jiangellaceae bacterium]|nr:DUF222 domain-containing protein [Jiangellaceae bacterium]